MSAIYLETSRLILRQWEQRDEEPYILLNADAAVTKFFPSIYTPEETRAQIARLSSHIAEHSYGFFAVERKYNHQFIGFTGLSHPRFESQFTPCVEIGWRLSKENWNLGFATEAAVACLDLGLNKLKLKEIYAFTSVHHKRSENVMKKIGMYHAGFFDHPSIADGHFLKAHVLCKAILNIKL